MPFEVARAIADDTVTQREVLGARGRAYRVGLDEAELPDCRFESGGCRERAPQRIPTKFCEIDRAHDPVP